MIIHHDTSYVKPSSAKWIAKGYAREDIYSLRLQFLYTKDQQAENRTAHTVGIRDTALLRQAAEHRNAVMAPIMGAIARNFMCYLPSLPGQMSGEKKRRKTRGFPFSNI